MKKVLFKAILFAFATIATFSANAYDIAPIINLPYTFDATNTGGCIDVDRNGFADFEIRFTNGSPKRCRITGIGDASPSPSGSLSITYSNNKILSEFLGEEESVGALETPLSPLGFYTSMLSKGYSINGATIGGLSWESRSNFFGVAVTSPSLSGTYYTGTQSGYVGIQFLIGGQPHYGWLNVQIDPSGQFVTINSAGYQASAGAPAVAGLNDPFAVPVPIIASLLGLVAIGGGIFLKRRKKSVC